MNYKFACKILDLDELDITCNKLKYKKNYKFFALKFHPDKNPHEKEKFLEIREACEFLEQFYENSETDYTEEKKQPEFETEYENLLFSFLNTYACPIFTTFITNLLLNFESTSNIDIEKPTFDVDQLWELYHFLKKYNNILHINDNIFNWLRSHIQKQYKNDLIIYLNPTITDLLDCNCFKLWEENEYYIVPLWHKEVHFNAKDSNKKIIVICEAEIKDNNIEIGDNYELIINHHLILSSSLLDQEEQYISIGNHKFSFPTSLIKIMPNQQIFVDNIGIPIASNNDIYKVEKKSGIVIKLTLH